MPGQQGMDIPFYRGGRQLRQHHSRVVVDEAAIRDIVAWRPSALPSGRRAFADSD
jgi:hypothetical protein